MRSFALAIALLLPVLGFAAAPTTSVDIGRVAAAGSTSVSSGVYTVKASGADIWDRRDEFRFVHGALNGDGEVTARVDSLTPTHPWAKAGVMIRENLGPSSRYAFTLVSAASGMSFQHRRFSGGWAAQSGSLDSSLRAPQWVRIRRVGNQFTAYVSADGQSWRQQGSSINIAMGADVYAGLAVTSHRDGSLATANFSNVNIAPVGATPVPTNTPPRISGTPSTTATVDAAYAFTPATTDPDGNTLTYSIANRPSWATFNAGTGRLAGTPTSAHVGTYTDIRISVSDGQAAAHLAPFSIAVSGASSTNRAPVISGTPPTTATSGTAYSFQPTASDPDGNPLTFSISNAPSWTTFSTSTGRLQGTPTSSNVGTFSNIVIRVSDGKASAQLPAFSIVVSGSTSTNRAPVISGAPATSVMQGNAYSFQPTASDPDGDALTFSIANKPSWATFSTSTGRLQGTPTSGDVGTYSNVTIRVSDGKTATSLAAFNITVLAVASGSATLSWTPPTQNTDGSTLTNLAGYRILWGPGAGNYTSSVTVNNPGLTSYVVDNLAPGTYYFAVSARNSAGVESAPSSSASKTIQ
jgi:hypothetical protein